MVKSTLKKNNFVSKFHFNYSGYSVRLICLTLLRLVPSFIYVTNFPYEKMINFLFVITETTFNPHHNRSIHPHQRTLLRSPWNRFQTCLFSPKKSEDSVLAHFFNSFQKLFLCMSVSETYTLSTLH